MTFFKTLAAAATAALIAGGAHAATLGLSQLPSPQIVDTDAEVFRTGDEIFVFGNSFTTTPVGFSAGPLPAFNFNASVDSSGVIGATGGSLGFDDFAGVTLGGSLVAFGSTIDPGGEDTLEFLYDNITGTAPFSEPVLVVLTGEFGDFLALPTFVGTGSAVAAPVAAPAVIPLPASVLLLASALGFLALRRRTA